MLKTGKIVKCSFCGKEIYRAGWEIKKKKNFFCRKDCRYKFLIGKKPTPETRKKLSEARLGAKNSFFGKKHSKKSRELNSNAHKKLVGEKASRWKGGLPKCVICGKKLGSRNANRCVSCFAKSRVGRRLPEQTRIKISLSHRGEKSYLWKGGISKKNEIIRKRIEYRLWREAVFARDNWACQECGQRGGELNAHHIKPFSKFNKLRFAIDNGITLCKKCHIKKHTKQ